eukprot:15183767-Alexandrium_andersonii.AAC.1
MRCDRHTHAGSAAKRDQAHRTGRAVGRSRSATTRGAFRKGLPRPTTTRSAVWCSAGGMIL